MLGEAAIHIPDEATQQRPDVPWREAGSTARPPRPHRVPLIHAEGFECSAAEIGALQEPGDAELDAVAVGGWGGHEYGGVFC